MDYIIEKHRIYATDKDGKMLADIEFPEVSTGVCEITHTYVDDSLRGQGVAAKLTEMAVAEIEGQGNKVTASCSYAIKWLTKREGREIHICPACGLRHHSQ
ncbi:GNAT family N-acetyltransferase [Selenomonas ruminantium]|uniref:N-acetyltransferase domain-containing protein n=1 Tax=Selenomonas ruminantium TaxID=971 RepID=A0A1H3VTT5_SELRU|nr:GNAT family N-acetyltransferase [Selenomonas ruminantium]SDZ77532.1 hypothetical protein SAMN05660648_00524 [Selenomonas ruminantium]